MSVESGIGVGFWEVFRMCIEYYGVLGSRKEGFVVVVRDLGVDGLEMEIWEVFVGVGNFFGRVWGRRDVGLGFVVE